MIATRFIVFCSLAWLLFDAAILAAAAESMARGKVVGIVSVAGIADKPKPLPVFKSRSFCGATVANETLLVGADGRTVRAYVTRRLGYGLDQRAVEAAMQYRFDPALVDGLPQTTWTDLKIRF